MYYIGLDQALRNTGWSIIRYDNKGIKLVDLGVFKTSSDLCLDQRLLNIKNFTEELILKYAPILICTEYVYQNKVSPSSSRNLIKVEAIVHSTIFENKIDYDIISSSKSKKGGWRKELGITESQKKESKLYFENISKDLTEHSSDSLAIILVGMLNNNIIAKSDIDDFRRKQ